MSLAGHSNLFQFVVFRYAFFDNGSPTFWTLQHKAVEGISFVFACRMARNLLPSHIVHHTEAKDGMYTMYPLIAVPEWLLVTVGVATLAQI